MTDMQRKSRVIIGADYGTNSVRLTATTTDGVQLGEFKYEYQMHPGEFGEAGIIIDPMRPMLAHQNPEEYFVGFERCLEEVLKQVDSSGTHTRADVAGIGIDTTGSTPIPVDGNMRPIGMARLWKDKVAAPIAMLMNRFINEGEWKGENYIAHTGGLTSAEWIIPKAILLRIAEPEVYANMASFVEHCDIMPAWLVGITDPRKVPRGVTAAGHKAHYNPRYGMPSQEFYDALETWLRRGGVSLPNGALGDLAEKLYSPDMVQTAEKCVGYLRKDLAAKFRLGDNVAIAGGSFDAHMGGVGAGIADGILVSLKGTSTCDMMILEKLLGIPGICGEVLGSIVPGKVGYEAGQSSAGDALRVDRDHLLRSRHSIDDNETAAWTENQKNEAWAFLARNAARYKPGDVRILRTDYFNGIRTPDVDPQACHIEIGGHIETSKLPGYRHRALLEAVGFGSAAIMNRFSDFGLTINEIVATGGMTVSDLAMQIHADIAGRPIRISGVKYPTCLGAAMYAAVAAGEFATIEQAQASMNPVATRYSSRVFEPNMENNAAYAAKLEKYQRMRTDLLPLVQELLR